MLSRTKRNIESIVRAWLCRRIKMKIAQEANEAAVRISTSLHQKSVWQMGEENLFFHSPDIWMRIVNVCRYLCATVVCVCSVHNVPFHLHIANAKREKHNKIGSRNKRISLAQPHMRVNINCVLFTHSNHFDNQLNNALTQPPSSTHRARSHSRSHTDIFYR